MTWTPPSGYDELSGCVWLPRLLAKARRHVAAAELGDYMFGDHDYLDAWLLRFLRTDEATVCAAVRSDGDDRAVARRLVEKSGRAPDELARFRRHFTFWNAPWLVMIDADEGRTRGPAARLLNFVYNRVVVPPAIAVYRRATARR